MAHSIPRAPALLAFLFPAFLFIAGCFGPLDGENGAGRVNVRFAPGGSARTVLPGPAELEGMTLRVVFTGPGGIVTKDFGPEGGDVSLSAGEWRLAARAYSGGGRLRGIVEDVPVRVRAGKNGEVAVTLKACIGIRSEQDLIEALSAAGIAGIGHDATSGNGDLLVLLNDITVTTSLSASDPAGSAGAMLYTLAGSGTITFIGSTLNVSSSNISVTLNGPTLQGRAGNTSPLVNVNGGRFTLENGNITGNSVTGSNVPGGVAVSANGSFTMNGGSINGNTAVNFGGGVLVSGGGTFIMNGGTISGNRASGGGGAYVYTGTFTMNGGIISGNRASSRGGGVSVEGSGIFIMNGGSVRGNYVAGSDASLHGGGVYVGGGTATFTLNRPAVQGLNGNIAGNYREIPANADNVYKADATVTVNGSAFNGAPPAGPQLW